jgi:deoxyribonuclease V
MEKINSVELLDDNITFKQARKIQIKYRNILKKREKNLQYIKSIKTISIIAGVDISYFSRSKKDWGVSCAVLWDLKKNKMIDTTFAQSEINFPYKPGFLGFRECKLLSIAIKKSLLKPELIFCDGHGINHPRKFGEAVQLGVALDIPSIGVAKNPFFGYSSYKTLTRRKGEKTPIWIWKPSNNLVNNENLGYSICLSEGKKPVFISVGYKVTLECALGIALKTSLKYRQPTPLFLADKFSRAQVKEILKKIN